MDLQNDQACTKSPWTPKEDLKLVEYINKHGEGKWKSLAKNARLNRTGKSCRARWVNHLKQEKKGEFTENEVQLILRLHDELGNKWSLIAAQVLGRTDNEIMNLWYSRLSKKRPDISMLDRDKVHQSKKQLNSTGLSSFSPTPIVSILYLPNNSYYINHDLEHYQPNNRNPVLSKGFSYSVPVPSSPSNFCINSHLDVEGPVIHSHIVFRPASTNTYPSERCMTSNTTITSMDNKGTNIKVNGVGQMNISIDELIRLIDSSPSSGPIPEWSELGD